MTIRKTTTDDLPAVMDIYACARLYMSKSGNPNQWKNNHPPKELIEQDIKEGTSYVCVRGKDVLAVFYFNVGHEPNYDKIDGKWLNDKPYGVIHRIARGPDGKGTGAFCINWCFDQHPNIKIDTHKNNETMIKLLEKLGFSTCGTIRLPSGDERTAFQKAE